MGGCSSHNGCVSLHTFEADCNLFQERGCSKWDFETFKRMIRKTRLQHQTIDPSRHNQLVTDWIQACSEAFDVPIISNINKEISETGTISGGTGYMPISYDTSSGDRVSASTAYIHPILRGEWARPNLKILLDAWVSKIAVLDDQVTGITILQDGSEVTLRHKIETILCAGAIDTPRLMLLSGLGPRQQLNDLEIPVIKHIPGVGENLQDHIETNIVWELTKPLPSQTVTYSDSFFFFERQSPPITGSACPDIMFHLYTVGHVPNFDHLGYEPPRYPLVIMPNVPRPKSRGRLFLTTKDPKVQPALDFRYFTDEEGYDEAVIVDGLKMARKLAETSPLKEWISREVSPGPQVVTDEDLSEYGRSRSTTCFHPCGTTKMGDLSKDPLAVVGPDYKVRGLRGLRIVDAGVMPVITTTNPVLTVIAIAEHAAELIASETRAGDCKAVRNTPGQLS